MTIIVGQLYLLFARGLTQQVATFAVKGQEVNILGFVSQMVSVITKVCHERANTTLAREKKGHVVVKGYYTNKGSQWVRLGPRPQFASLWLNMSRDLHHLSFWQPLSLTMETQGASHMPKTLCLKVATFDSSLRQCDSKAATFYPKFIWL